MTVPVLALLRDHLKCCVRFRAPHNRELRGWSMSQEGNGAGQGSGAPTAAEGAGRSLDSLTSEAFPNLIHSVNTNHVNQGILPISTAIHTRCPTAY